MHICGKMTMTLDLNTPKSAYTYSLTGCTGVQPIASVMPYEVFGLMELSCSRDMTNFPILMDGVELY